MLHFNSDQLSNDSKSYLLSVLMDPDEILDLVKKRFEIHLKNLTRFSPAESGSVLVRSTINLLSKDFRLIFELNCSMHDLFKGCEVKVFDDEYLRSVQDRFETAMKIFEVK